MPSKLLKDVRRRRNLERAWSVIQDNARTSKSKAVKDDIESFRENVTGNIERIYRELHGNTFAFPPAKGIASPKKGATKTTSIRPIVLAPTKSRIVQRALLNVLTDLPGLQRYLASPFSFGGMRKTELRRLSAVPAAIDTALEVIGHGANHVMCADISRFFTRISKSAVSSIVAAAANDTEFMAFFKEAIHVELSNMAELRAHAKDFPIEDIGVAQGNSLSPLLGNILLHEFDEAMNAGDCRCIRYIDDILILAPTRNAAVARMRLATKLLAEHGMDLSLEKSSREPVAVENAFSFLGIELANGRIRPTREAQRRFMESIELQFSASAKAFESCRREGRMDKSLSLIAVLTRVDGIIRGWGKHYRFCNDEDVFKQLDLRIGNMIRAYIGGYSGARSRVEECHRPALLGVEQLGQMTRQPLQWPDKSVRMQTAA